MTDIQKLKGIGPKRAGLFHRLGIYTINDLLLDLPRSYEDRGQPVDIAQLQDQDQKALRVSLVSLGRLAYLPGRRTIQTGVFADPTGTIKVTWHNQPYLKRNLHIGDSFYLYGKYSKDRGGMANPRMKKFQADNEDKVRKDFLNILPIYRLTEGLTNNFRIRTIKQVFAKNHPIQDYLPEALQAEIGSLRDCLLKVHLPQSSQDLEIGFDQIRLRRAMDEVLLRRLVAQDRARSLGPKMRQVDLTPFLNQLDYDLTPSQEEALAPILKDLLSPKPMNRLLQGDVGSGKTVLALAAAYLVMANGWQAVFMAPTEILAHQHLEKAGPFFQKLGFPTYLLTGSSKSQERKSIREAAKAGRPGLFIGTHALFTPDLEFAHLGLTITDEQHRFGVRQRESLQEKARLPNSLVLSATPIPRTLALVEYGDLDMARIRKKPQGRPPIPTYVVDGRYEKRIYTYLKKKQARGEKAYLVCPRIEAGDSDLDYWSLERVEERVRKFFGPASGIGVLTGQMDPEAKDRVMEDFQAGRVQILLATTVVEVGIDVKDATSMVILAADQFGLSQLHQLRGRVGRGDLPSICILLAHSPSKSSIERLKVLEATEDGLEIARKDLEIRGAGDRFGTHQHGLVDQSLVPVSPADRKAGTDLFTKLYGGVPSLDQVPLAWRKRVVASYKSLASFNRN